MKALAVVLISFSAALHAQTAPAPATTLPSEPAGIAYRYFPHQLVQWVGPELPYSMIELEIDDRGAKPIYDAILTDRATNKRVHYTNEQSEVLVDKFIGAEVHLVPMQLDAPAEAAKGATYLLRFTTETGAPVTWQFVLGSDVTEQGSGMTPIPVPGSPALIYREQGGVAGEGTALKVGNITSTADVWKEISQPPYFIAYHGALSQDVHTLAFVPRTNDWKIEPPTSAVAADAEWKLTSADGRVLSAHVDSFTNGLATLHITHPILATSVMVEARQTPTGWALERLRYAPEGNSKEHTITLTFSPESAGTSKFEIVAGKKTHLTSGELAITANGGESWTLTQPPFTHLPPVVASATQTRGATAALATAQSATPEASAAH
jgi:hypothetical protein